MSDAILITYMLVGEKERLEYFEEALKPAIFDVLPIGDAGFTDVRARQVNSTKATVWARFRSHLIDMFVWCIRKLGSEIQSVDRGGLDDLATRETVRSRVLRFYGQSRFFPRFLNKLFNRTSLRVVVFSERSIGQSGWNTVAELNEKLQGVPSMMVLCVPLRNSAIVATAFSSGFDEVIESVHLSNLEPLVRHHFDVIGRNRVSKSSLLLGFILGISSSFIVGFFGGVGSTVGEHPITYWTRLVNFIKALF